MGMGMRMGMRVRVRMGVSLVKRWRWEGGRDHTHWNVGGRGCGNDEVIFHHLDGEVIHLTGETGVNLRQHLLQQHPVDSLIILLHFSINQPVHLPPS